MSKVQINNIDSVSFGNAEIETTLKTGLDGDAPEEHRRELTLSFELSDDEDVKQFLMERLAAALRIKCNQKDEVRFKGNPKVKSYEDFAQHIDDMGGSYHFDEEELIDLLTPSKRTAKSMSQEDWVWYQYKQGEITEEQRDQMLAIIEA
jgi:hypothetical protein